MSLKPIVEADIAGGDQFIASFEGEEGTWKTSLALQGPGRIGYLNFDRGLGRAKIPMVKGKPRPDLTVGHYPFRREGKDAVKRAQKLWAEAEKDIHKSIDENPLTIVDTLDMLYECLRLAELEALEQVKSRYYGSVNRNMNDIFDHALDSGNNLIVICPVKEIYKNDKGTGKMGPKGWSDVVYRVNQRFLFEWDAKTKAPKVTVLKPRGVETPVLLNPDFAELAMAVLPESDEEQWEVEFDD